MPFEGLVKNGETKKTQRFDNSTENNIAPFKRPEVNHPDNFDKSRLNNLGKSQKLEYSAELIENLFQELVYLNSQQLLQELDNVEGKINRMGDNFPGVVAKSMEDYRQAILAQIKILNSTRPEDREKKGLVLCLGMQGMREVLKFEEDRQPRFNYRRRWYELFSRAWRSY